VHASSPSARAGHQSSSQQTSASTANNTSGNNVRNGTNEFPTGENSRESPMSKQGDIYIDPQCQSISNYNTNHPREVELDKTKRTEGHIGPGLVSRVYAVAIGRRVGVYSNWKDCEAQIKGYTRASFKAFYTLEDAVQFIHSNDSNVRGKKRPLETNGETTSNKRVHEESDEKFDLDITIYFDGGSRGNPGVAGAGAEVKIKSKDKLTTYHIREYCGDKQTNNFAEYTGLIVGLKLAHQRICDHTNSVDRPKHPSWRPSYRVRAFGDSNLIIQQMKGSWQCKNANIKALYAEAVHCYGKIMSQIGPKGTVEFEHVYREDNKMADGEFVLILYFFILIMLLFILNSFILL
jgi:ribonuclease HI